MGKRREPAAQGDHETLAARLNALLALQDELAVEQAKAHGEATRLADEWQGAVEGVADLEMRLQEIALDILDLGKEAATEIRKPAALVLYEGAKRRPWHRPLVRWIAAACGFPATREKQT